MMSKKCFIVLAQILLGHCVCSPIGSSSLFAQPQEFTLMGRQYRHEAGKWYTFFQGQIGNEIIPKRIIARLSDRGSLESFDFTRFNIQGLSVASRRFLNGFYVLAVQENADPFQIATQLEQMNLFDVLEFDAYGQNESVPNDPQYPNQWNLKDDKLKMEKAWDISTGSNSIILAIIDTGVLHTHEDLSDNIWVNPAEDRNGNGRPDFSSLGQGGDLDGVDNDGNGYIDDLMGWDFDANDNFPEPYSHGTSVAGVAGARINNALGVAGIAGGWGTQQGVKLMILNDTITGDQPTVSAMA